MGRDHKNASSSAFLWRNPSTLFVWVDDGFRNKQRVKNALFICSTHPTKAAEPDGGSHLAPLIQHKNLPLASFRKKCALWAAALWHIDSSRESSFGFVPEKKFDAPHSRRTLK
jgi:hypothetical protein